MQENAIRFPFSVTVFLKFCTYCTDTFPLIQNCEYGAVNFGTLETYLLSRETTDTAVWASRPVVGSSRKRTWGSIMSSIPMLVLFLSPPDTPRKNGVPIWLIEGILIHWRELKHRCMCANICTGALRNYGANICTGSLRNYGANICTGALRNYALQRNGGLSVTKNNKPLEKLETRSYQSHARHGLCFGK